MQSPETVKLKNLADMELAYRRLRDDMKAIETLLTTVNDALAALTVRVEALE